MDRKVVVRMQLHQIEYFVKLAETEHMTETAKYFHTTQPNISYAIKQLETEFGCPLIQHTGRNIELSKYGKVLYNFLVNGMNEFQNGKETVQHMINPTSGIINFGYIYTMGYDTAPWLIKEFLSQEENTNLEFSISQNDSASIVSSLQNQTLDIALTSHVLGLEDIINFVPFKEQKLVCVVPEGSTYAKKDSISLEEISKASLIYYSKNSGLRYYLNDLFENHRLTPSNIVMEATEDNSILGLVSNDFGIAVIVDLPTISSFPVKVLPITDTIKSRYIYIATMKNQFISPPVKRFYDFCLTKNNVI